MDYSKNLNISQEEFSGIQKKSNGEIEIELDVLGCIGAGPCEIFASNTFGIDEGTGKAYIKDDSWDSLEDINKAVESCPVRVIKLRILTSEVASVAK